MSTIYLAQNKQSSDALKRELCRVMLVKVDSGQLNVAMYYNHSTMSPLFTAAVY